ncbi:hypothetical protein RB594_006712 [Gaeumannomyces avenae]
MAVTDENLSCYSFYPSENLISKQPRRHFRTTVSPLHWQLRSLIGAGPDGVVYFPTGINNIHLQKLDTKTLETETLSVLTFSPRCLVAKNGWVCCGGETGEFTALNLGPSGPDTRRDPSTAPEFELDVDARLPLDTTSRPDDSLLALLGRSRNSISQPNKKFGRERVNCITLWFPHQSADQRRGPYRSPVAVLANNDKHVTLIDLETLDALDELEYPEPMNRAVLSPDGRTLVAVGDDPYLYVHERTERTSAFGSRAPSTGRPRHYFWKETRRVHLKSQHKDDRTDQRGSFAACFSNTGTYLAVGTQYGIISIFNTSALLDTSQDPLLAFFPSSRPTSPNQRPSRGAPATTCPGAVREMSFSPGPYDLLAWSEDRGRAGIADVRGGFVARQILYLDAQDTFQHLDLTVRNAIDPSLLESTADRSDALASSFENRLDLSEARRSLNRRLQSGVERYHYPLTGDETQVLEALQEHRRRREQRAAAARELLLSSRNQLSSSLSRLGARTAAGTTGTAPGSSTAAAPTAVPRPRDRIGDRGSTEGRGADWARASRDHIEQLIENMSSVAGFSDAFRRQESPRPREDSRREAGMPGYRHLYRELLDRFARETDDDILSGVGHGSTSTNAGILASATVRATIRAAAAGEGAGVADGAPADGAGSSGSGSSSVVPDSGAASTRAGLSLPRLSRSQIMGPYNVPSARYRDWTEPGVLYGISSGGTDGVDGPSTAVADRTGGRGPMAWESLLTQVAMRTDGRDQDYRTNELASPDETAGLSWSEDGSLLYVGAENGIYEFRVNIASRKLLPSITLR